MTSLSQPRSSIMQKFSATQTATTQDEGVVALYLTPREARALREALEGSPRLTTDAVAPMHRLMRLLDQTN